MEAVYWVTAIASVVAVWLNIKQRAVCFAIWAVTNATWTVVDYLHGIHAQAGRLAAKWTWPECRPQNWTFLSIVSPSGL